MTPEQLLILLPAFFLLAGLYTSVGHAGASGYLAAMALLAIAPETMRPRPCARRHSRSISWWRRSPYIE